MAIVYSETFHLWSYLGTAEATCGSEEKILQKLSFFQFLKKWYYCKPPILGILYPKDYKIENTKRSIYTHVHMYSQQPKAGNSSNVHHQMNGQRKVPNPYNGLWSSLWKEGNADTCLKHRGSKEEPLRNKPEANGQRQDSVYVKYLD